MSTLPGKSMFIYPKTFQPGINPSRIARNHPDENAAKPPLIIICCISLWFTQYTSSIPLSSHKIVVFHIICTYVYYVPIVSFSPTLYIPSKELKKTRICSIPSPSKTCIYICIYIYTYPIKRPYHQTWSSIFPSNTPLPRLRCRLAQQEHLEAFTEIADHHLVPVFQHLRQGDGSILAGFNHYQWI